MPVCCWQSHHHNIIQCITEQCNNCTIVVDHYRGSMAMRKSA